MNMHKRSDNHMIPRWQIGDLFDLEFFIRQDQSADADKLAARDRNIYLQDIAPVLDTRRLERKSARRLAVKFWLNHRRSGERKDPAAVLPGDVFREVQGLLRIGLAVAGLFMGGGAALGLLAYRGVAPINVSMYLGVFILPQILLLALLVLLLLVHAPGLRLGENRGYPILRQLMGRMLLPFMRRNIGGRISAEKRNAFQDALGLFKTHQRTYGAILFWPVFLLAQLFAVGFNAGVLLITLLKVLGADLAFGWQSTLQLSPELIHRAVQWIALPWSWLLEAPQAYPTIDQIQGSRMVLKNGMLHLATPDLAAWWPFLCMAVLCYGLLPRFVLFLVGLTAQHRSLATIPLNHEACRRLLGRMQTPILSTRITVVTDAATATSRQQSDEPNPSLAIDRLGTQVDGWALVPEELRDLYPQDLLTAALSGRPGIRIRGTIHLRLDADADETAIRGGLPENAGPMMFLILQEAWQPPITETLRYYQSLAGHFPEATLQIVLIGKPDSQSGLPGSDPRDAAIWLRQIQNLGEPNIRIFQTGDGA